MGLNDQYTAIRGQILMMNPLSSLNTAYALLLQEEHQRNQLNVPAITTEVAAMSFKSPGPRQLKPHTSKNSISSGLNTSTKPTNSGSCSYCHQTNSTNNKCFFLHGYPPWHHLYGHPKPKLKPAKKFTVDSSKPPAANLIEHTSQSQSNSVEGTSSNNTTTTFNAAQCQQIMELIQASFQPSPPLSP